MCEPISIIRPRLKTTITSAFFTVDSLCATNMVVLPNISLFSAPFQNWDLPQGLLQARERLGRTDDGDRQFVGILAAIRHHGLVAVESACKEALLGRSISRDLVLNILSRANEPSPPSDCQLPNYLPQLSLPPKADCTRYNRLLSGGHHAS